MSTALLGLRTCIYKVSDIKKATEWYSSILEQAPYFEEPFYVGFNVAGYELGLQPQNDDNVNKTESVGTYWGVEDVEAWFKKLINAGGRQNEEPTDVGGGIVVASVKDPWGNVFGLIYNPHFHLPPTLH